MQLGELSIAAVAILCLLGDNLSQLSGKALSNTHAVLVASGVSYLLCVTRPLRNDVCYISDLLSCQLRQKGAHGQRRAR